MFSKYFRYYPWGLQLFLLLMLMFTLASFIAFLQFALVPKFFHTSLQAIAGVSTTSPRSLIDAAMVTQLATHLFTFTLPALLFAYWAHPQWRSYLGFRHPGKNIQWLIVPLLMVSALPFILFLDGWLRAHIPIPERFVAMQKANDRLVEAFLTNRNMGEYLLSLLVLAVAPAVGEELLFRGLLMRFAAKSRRGIGFALVLSSLLFMMMHTNPTGWLSIFLAGILLGLTYYLTSSLWMAVLMHFINNAAQVTLMAFAQNHTVLKRVISESEVPVGYALLSLVMTGAMLYWLWKKRTPLPPHWHHDFHNEPTETSTTPNSLQP